TSLRDELLREREDLESAKAQYESRLKQLRADSTRSREEALRSADRLLKEANARIERTIREIKESQADREATRRARARLETFRAKVEEEIEDIEEDSTEVPEAETETGALRVGDQVVLDEGSVRAEITEIDGTHAVIVNRMVQLRVALDRLTRVGGKSPQRVDVRQPSVTSGGLASQAVSQRIDVRGRRVEEALREVGRFIDVAIPSSLKVLEIVHGKGTGALRAAIWEYLESRPEIAAFEEADIEHGGAGMTIIHLQ
ncbi:MAG: Smr/MutS family protein, partial [Rhodothermales bacterium]|nr:Smr/MutS family protein [Rhodothermales bacterium]